MKYFIFFVCLGFSISGLAQAKHDYNWILGTFDNEGIKVSFQQGGVGIEVTPRSGGFEMSSNSTAISNDEGNLLFYTNGCRLVGNNHELIDNGNGLNPGAIYDIFCPGGYPIIQGTLALPSGDHPERYLLFHNRAVNSQLSDTLFMTKIGVQSDGTGEVIEKNLPVLGDSLWLGYLTAVRHIDGADWWIIAPGYFPGQFHQLLLSGDSIVSSSAQDFFLGIEEGGWGSGQVAASSDGTKYVHYGRFSQAYLYDFDRATGMLSDPVELFVNDSIISGGVAFSPSGRFLYVASHQELYQYDLEADDPDASKLLIDVYDGFTSPLKATFKLMQLAPDCRIYMSTGNGTDRLHVIDYPDRKGEACSFRQHAIVLPSSNFKTIPNHPNYRLGTPYPVCDSTIQLVSSTVRVLPPTEQVRLWPNPASGAVNVELSRPLAAVAFWRLYSGTGALVREVVLPAGQVQYAADISGLPGGLYFWELRGEEGKIGSGKLVLK